MATPSISSIGLTDIADTLAISSSPCDVANTAVAETIAESARAQDDPDTLTNTLPSDERRGIKRGSHSTSDDMDHETRVRRLMKIGDNDERYEQVTHFFLDAIDALMQEGLHGFHMHDSAARNLELAKEEMESKDREIQRLRASEESSRKTIMNLLQSVEIEKSAIRDSSRQTQVEARLRAELSSIRGARDEVLSEASLLKRKVATLEADHNATTKKLLRSEQEKIKMERDNRAAISLAKSVGCETSSDVDFYKRKTIELQNQLSAQQALVAEQKTQIDEMRRQLERSMSQNRLASIRAECISNGRKSF